MDVHARPLSRPGQKLRQGLRRVFRARDERGAVVVEFAIVLPLLLTLTFGIIEYSGAYHDSAIAADAARAGGRVGSALGTHDEYSDSIVSAVDSALTTLPADGPKELWIYKANAKGFPGSGTNFSSCSTNCIKYLWDSGSRSFNTANPQGGGWPAAQQQVCTQPYDELGVYVKIHHKFATGLFGAGVDVEDHSVFRFEPVPTSVCG